MNAEEYLRTCLAGTYREQKLDEALAAARREGYDNGLAENPDIGIGAAFAAGHRKAIKQSREQTKRLRKEAPWPQFGVPSGHEASARDAYNAAIADVQAMLDEAAQ